MTMFRNKVKSEEGASLGEMLVTVLIMSLVTLAIASGVTAGIRVYHRITQRAEAETLLATNVAAVSEYLEKGSGISVTDNSTQNNDNMSNSGGTVVDIETSEVSQAHTELWNNGTKGIYIHTYDDTGDNENNNATVSSETPLISEGVNTSGLYARLKDNSGNDAEQSQNVNGGGNQTNESGEKSRLSSVTIEVCKSSNAQVVEKAELNVCNTIHYPTVTESTGS